MPRYDSMSAMEIESQENDNDQDIQTNMGMIGVVIRFIAMRGGTIFFSENRNFVSQM